MPKLVILRGLPASGKSTVADELLGKGYDVVCYDDIHFVFFGKYDFNRMKEVVEEGDRIFNNAVRGKQNIVIDNTNLRQGYINKWVKMAPDDYEIEVKLIHPGIEVCLVRNTNRDRGSMTVPNSVIRNMAERCHLFDDEFDTIDWSKHNV